jgi:uncharacterized protein YjdB
MRLATRSLSRSRLFSVAALAVPMLFGCTSHRTLDDGGTMSDGGGDADGGQSDGGINDGGVHDGGNPSDGGSPGDGGVSGQISIRITGAPMSGLQVGATAQLHVVALDAAGNQTDVTAHATLTSSNPGVASVSSGGTLTGVARGSSVIQAGLLSGNTTLQASTTVNVVSMMGNTTVSVQVAPGTLSLAPGLGSQLSANATQADGTQLSVTAQANWISSDTSLCTVDNTSQRGYVTAIAVGTCNVSAAFGGQQGTAVISIKAISATALAITPGAATIAAGGNAQLTATATLSDGSVADATHSAVWSTSDAGKATVAAGLVSGASAGSATITATLGNLSATAAISVSAATLKAISVAPPQSTIAAGLTQKFSATAVYSDGTTGDISSAVTWTSSAPPIAALDSSTPGLVHALAFGKANIVASLSGVSGAALISVTNATPTRLTLIPAPITLPIAVTQQLVARAVFSDNSVRDVAADATWSVGNSSLATVSATGLVTGTAVGTTTISATLSGITATANLTVTAAVLTQILLLPQNASVPIGGAHRLIATGIYGDNSLHDVTEQATWTSSAAAIAGVSNSAGSRGTVTGVAAGSADVIATLGGVSSSPASISVTSAALVSLQFQPRKLLTALYITVPSHVLATYADGSQVDVTSSAVFSSSSTSIATVVAAGVAAGQVTGVSQGMANITATLAGQSASAQVTVVPAMLQSITVKTRNMNGLEIGQSEQVTATAQFQGAPVGIDVTTLVTWTSSDTTVGTFLAFPRGYFTAQGAGTTTVAAELDGISGTKVISVGTIAPIKITVFETTFTLPIGVTHALIANGTYADGSTQDLTYGAQWTSDANAVAVVGNGGLLKGFVTGVSAGTAHVTATLAGISGSATVTVDSSHPTSIQVAPRNQTVTQTGMGGGFRPTVGFQFYATANFSDGTAQDVTQSCVWTSTNPMVATISDSAGTRGQADIIATGITTISATFRGLSDTTPLTSR